MAKIPTILVRWEYCTVKSEMRSGSMFAYDLVLQGSDPRTVFASVDAALSMLGTEGWECILFHRDDGPRQQMIPMSLHQPLPFPARYELRFKRVIVEG